MPSMYDLQLAPEENGYVLKQHLVAKGTFVEPGTVIALLEADERSFHLRMVKAGLLVEWLVETGAVVDAAIKLARIVAEAEDMPMDEYPDVELLDEAEVA